MLTTKSTVLLLVILCVTFSKSAFAQTNNSGSFTFTLSANARTSAGVYKTDSTLVRTLWADKNYAAGTYTEYWDGKDDYGATINSPDPNYVIKILSNNVSYTWDGIIGNTSASQTGSGVHRGYYTSMTGMAITGTTAYFCQGYSEAYSSEAKFDINNPQIRLNIFAGQVSTMNADFVATDGINVYWAGYDAYKSANSFVHATAVSNDAQVSFGTNGSSYTMQQIGSPKTYTSVIDKLNTGGSKPSGLAVQQTGKYLFVAHSGLNELHVIDKSTGALVQNLSYASPRYISTDGSNLWMVTGTNTIGRYTVNSNGTLSSATLTLSGITTPGAVQSNGNGTVAIIDQDNQVVRFFSASTGVEGTQLGSNGGYANSPDVTNTKFMFDDYRGNTFSFLAFAPDGSFWLGDPGNSRELHFSASKTYIEYIMSMGSVYTVSADPNNINRVFANYLEFNVDYTKSLSGSTGWTLVRNWGFGSSSNTQNWKLLNVVTLSNGRTYGRSFTPGQGYSELTPTGLRPTGVAYAGPVNSDGSMLKITGSPNMGSHITYTKCPLTGFDGSGNPIWGAGMVIATTPANTINDPNVNPGAVTPIAEYNYVTKSGKVIFYNPSVYSVGNTSVPWVGYHLGALKAGANSWTWETQKANHINYAGSFPEADYFEMGNGVNNFAGSHLNVVDNNIFTGYHGEFWKNSQTNYYNHYYEDGLAIGQFGYDRYTSSSIAGYGVAGNALGPIVVKDVATGNLYLYHGDESIHAGMHRWKISNLNSIKEQYVSVPFPSNYNRIAVGYLDLHAGLPFDSPLPNSAGWSKSGTVASNTSQKKYVDDGSPDVFSTFNQSSGSAIVQRDLGTNNVSASWKISGEITFEGSDVNAGSQTVAYIDVLDAAGKILSRFYYTNVSGVTTVFGNDKVIVQSNVNLGSTLLSMQPFEVNVSNGKVTIAYANYSPVSTTVFDPAANWKSPQTLRAYFVSGFPSYGKNIGFMDMKFYKDYVVSTNIPPIADAGLDTAIVLPANSAKLNGKGTDSDGNITNYSWSKISGPSSGAITNVNSAVTPVTSLSQGTYNFELKVTDNMGAFDLDTVQIIVNPSTNLPPLADAGVDTAIVLPVNTAKLNGKGTDSDGNITNYSWSKISGPSSGAITNANSAATPVTSLSQGTYKFELKVTDNMGAFDLDTVQIIVNPPANLPPVANAGPDQKITLPVNIVSLAGSGGDADGSIVSYLWTKISGPSSFNIVNSSSPVTDISGLVAGVYNFKLQVADNNGATASDTIQVTVNTALNVAPIADAGQDITIITPASTVSLKGSGTDSDGSIVNYLWAKVSGPSSYNISTASLPATNITGLVMGTYMFELKVTDNNGAIGTDTIMISVAAPANIPPSANAGKDQTISLPKNSLQLIGNGMDPDGSIVSYLWAEISGPSTGVIASANYPATSIATLVQGIYLFELMVTDDRGAVGKDTMKVTVVPASLPLKLLSFSGALQNDKINLQWETTNEKNVLGFEIERITGATWNKIGFVASSSVNALSNHYAFTDSFPQKAINYYRLKIVDIDGKFVYSDIISIEVKPDKNLIYQNFPNPFSNFTTIKFEIAEKGPVKIVVYTAIGIRIAVLLDEVKEPGIYQVKWNAKDIAPGNYFYTVIIGENIMTKKILKLH